MKKNHPSPSDLKTRLIRASVETWRAVKALSYQLDISMADALDKLIVGLKPEPEPEPEAPRQIPVPVFFKPKAIKSNGAGAFMPKSISSGNAIRFKVKSIK
ncbi:hypothetical protein ES703_102029 [subsurface metagenome]